MLRRDTRRGRWRSLLVVAALLLLAVGGLQTFRTGGEPEVEIAAALPGIGPRTPLRVTVAEPRRGLARIEVELVQGERVESLGEREHPTAPPWALWERRGDADRFELEVGRETIQDLRPGEATLRVRAWPAGTWLLRPEPRVEELTLPVRFDPPPIGVLSTHHHLAQGGCEAVVYRVGERAVRDGVQAGDRWFPGFRTAGGDPGLRFALLAMPYDLDDPESVRLVAVDELGNRGEAAFVDRFFPRPPARDQVELTRSFMERVVPQILANSPEVGDRGELLASYLAINGELRRANADTLEELADRSREEFLWREPFLALPNAQVMSAFADRRTYLFEGRTVDQQDHLGFDLASLSRAPVPAANSGVVVLARYLGIYGNTVVLDHGYGLMSLYGHLSSIEVEEGRSVERGQPIGRTGQTGLAGGDHLHFTMLLRGLPVNPIEWWDGHWIADRLNRKLDQLASLAG